MLYCGYTTTDEMVKLIMEYFSDKKKAIDKTIAEQKKFAESLTAETV